MAGPSMPDAQGHYGREQYRHWLKMAAANYQKLKDDLVARQTTGALPATEDSILRQAEFAEAECRFDLGKYDKAIRLYEVLVGRYHHKAESLDALAQITRCLWVKRQPEKALKTLERLGAALKDMDDASLSGSTVQPTRPAWEDWLEKATKLCVVPSAHRPSSTPIYDRAFTAPWSSQWSPWGWCKWPFTRSSTWSPWGTCG